MVNAYELAAILDDGPSPAIYIYVYMCMVLIRHTNQFFKCGFIFQIDSFPGLPCYEVIQDYIVFHIRHGFGSVFAFGCEDAHSFANSWY